MGVTAALETTRTHNMNINLCFFGNLLNVICDGGAAHDSWVVSSFKSERGPGSYAKETCRYSKDTEIPAGVKAAESCGNIIVF